MVAVPRHFVAALALLLAACGPPDSLPRDAANDPADAGLPDGATPPSFDAGPMIACREAADAGVLVDFDEWTDRYCDHVCSELFAKCHTDAWHLANRGPFEIGACLSMCRNDVLTEPLMIGNYHCHAPTCEQSFECIDAAPYPIDPACVDFCREGDRCDALGLFEYRGETLACQALCTGSTIYGNFAFEATCIANALADGCNIPRAINCYRFVEAQCQHVCAHTNGHSGAGCPPGTAYGDLFPTEAICAELCSDLSPAEALAVGSCISATDCDGAAACWPAAAPSAVPECAPLCTDLLANCPGFEIPNQLLCETWCAQLHQLRPAFPACLGELNFCPGVPNDLTACPDTTIEGPCAIVCELLDCCMPGAGVGCEPECVRLHTDTPPIIEDLAACLAASPDCDAADSCIAAAGINP
ncbi:MAG: hypothetical protein EXR73_00845 [Myxococcales bacterium]|nr:hypothetical protein [Myxococcales bacterium]